MIAWRMDTANSACRPRRRIEDWPRGDILRPDDDVFALLHLRDDDRMLVLTLGSEVNRPERRVDRDVLECVANRDPVGCMRFLNGGGRDLGGRVCLHRVIGWVCAIASEERGVELRGAGPLDLGYPLRGREGVFGVLAGAL